MRTFGGNLNPYTEVSGPNDGKLFTGTFEEHHGIPREIFSGSNPAYDDSREFLSRIDFDGENFDRNGIFVFPVSDR